MPQGVSGRVKKISPTPGFDPWTTVQFISSRYNADINYSYAIWLGNR
jgi:hypothetical protein